MTKVGIIILILAAVSALYAGYVWGFKKGMEAGILEQSQLVTPTPGVETGYENPFEGVKLNPFR